MNPRTKIAPDLMDADRLESLRGYAECEFPGSDLWSLVAHIDALTAQRDAAIERSAAFLEGMAEHFSKSGSAYPDEAGRMMAFAGGAIGQAAKEIRKLHKETT